MNENMKYENMFAVWSLLRIKFNLDRNSYTAFSLQNSHNITGVGLQSSSKSVKISRDSDHIWGSNNGNLGSCMGMPIPRHCSLDHDSTKYCSLDPISTRDFSLDPRTIRAIDHNHC